MKAALVYGTDDIRFADAPEPIIESPNQVKIRVKVSGICRSDVPRVLSGTARYFPIILGHEFSGIVDEIGSEVTNVKVGDHVAGVPLVPCFDCPDCKKGDYALCKNYSFIGSRQQGADAEFVVVPSTNVVKIEDTVSFEQGALIETATIALHGMLMAGFNEETAPLAESVAVFGCGTVGLFAIQWARILGAKKIVAIARDEERLTLAMDLGATHTINTKDYSIESIEAMSLELTDGKGFSFVFDSAGVEDTIRQAYRVTGNKGKICVIGTPTEDVRFSWQEWELMNRKEFTVTGSWMGYSEPFPGKEWEMAAEAMKSGALIFDDRMIYKRFDLANAREAFDCFKNEKVKGRILLINDR